MEHVVVKTADFELSGDGSHTAWNKADWLTLERVGKGAAAYRTRAKVMWSDKGLYCLFDCLDKILNCAMTQDGDKIYQEDVVEVFLWPNQAQTIYFEYEISPLGVELPIMVPNHHGQFLGWLPWQYEGNRQVRRKVSVFGGPAKSFGEVDGWRAEFCIPFALLYGLGNVPPQPGTHWRANLYRIDYDQKPSSHWAWCTATGDNYHDIQKFGTLVFGA